MVWTLTANGRQRLVDKYGLCLRGWPPHILFQTPSSISSNDELRQILTRFEHGKIWFEQLSDEERARDEWQRVREVYAVSRGAIRY